MSSLAARAEVLKLSRALGCPTDELEFLASHPPAELAELRHATARALQEEHAPALSRAVSASRLLPAGLTARVSEQMLDPALAARMATQMPPDRAAKVVDHLSTEYLADVAQILDPAGARGIVERMSDELVLEVADVLLGREEYLSLARFVDVASDTVVAAVLSEVADEQLLHLALGLESTARLDEIMRDLDDERVAGTVRAAVRAGLPLEALTLTAEVDGRNLARLAAGVAELDDDELTEIVRTTTREQAWSDALRLVASMEPEQQRRMLELPVSREPEVLAAIVAAVHDEDLWAQLVGLLELMDRPHLELLAEVELLYDPEVARAVVRASVEVHHWAPLLRIAEELEDAFRERVADVLAHLDAQELHEVIDRLPDDERERALRLLPEW
jgi:hypothetical protein